MLPCGPIRSRRCETDFFATAAKGTEPALRDELRELRLRRVRCDRGGVHFAGEFEDGWRACLGSRIALRILQPLAVFAAAGAEALYDGVRALDWREHLDAHRTLAVTAVCRDSQLRHTNFIAQKVKDAVVDQLRERLGARPSVDRRDPDVPLFLHLVKDRATLYLDLAGESLHRRGWRRRTIEATLKESLAAALLRLSGWDRQRPLCDPMCGSGTLLIEADLWARGVAPGLSRKRFAFERWPRFDATCRRRWAELREQAQAAILPRGPKVTGFDVDEQAVAASRTNARAAGAVLRVERRDVFELQPLEPPGWIVTNPPYGKRLDVDRDFFRRLGGVLRGLRGHRVGLLAGSQALARAVPLKPERWWLVFNGDLECRFLLYEVGLRGGGERG